MLDFNFSEMAVVAIVALVVIGPKDLPKAMRVVGYWVGRARGVARQFRAGFDEMIREAELAEMEKKWKEENERIMRLHPPSPVANDPAAPAPAGAPYEDGDDGQDDVAPVLAEKPVVTAAPDSLAHGAGAPAAGSPADRPPAGGAAA